MLISYNWLQSYFSKQLPKPKKLAEVLAVHSFETVGHKTQNDYVFDVDVLPNRAHDCLSHVGVAREVAAITQIPLRIFTNNLRIKENKKTKTGNILKVEIKDKLLCPRYAAYVIEGVKIAESPEWVKKRLVSIGQKTINNVVDITNYIMWEFGQPLHAFDFGKIKGAKMTIRISKKGEVVETLDGAVNNLGDNAIIIEDSGRIIDLAGIKGGANTQIDKKSNTIIFQAAIFDSNHIRKTTQSLGIKTDASVRYVHGFDPELPLRALERAVELLKETNPEARIVQKTDIYPKKYLPKKIKLDLNYVKNLLGIEISKKEIANILSRLGFSPKADPPRADKFQIGVPTFRLDVNLPEDIIEEIGRIYGYGKIEPIMPVASVLTPSSDENLIWHEKIKSVFVGAGFNEVLNYSFVSEKDNSFYNFKNSCKLLNPLSSKYSFLRPVLLINLLKNVELNFKYFDGMKIFELGKTYTFGKASERYSLAGSIAGKDAQNDFYELKGVIEHLFKRLGISDVWYDDVFEMSDYNKQVFQGGSIAQIKVNGLVLGIIGKVSRKTLSYFGIKGNAFVFEIDLDMLVEAASKEIIYEKPSVYPTIIRDVSLVVDSHIKVVDILNVINSVGKKLICDVDLFDIYENLDNNKKSLAFHVVYQSRKRTLTDNEVNVLHSKIEEALEKEVGAEVRRQ